ncbi:hypothetical protein GCM10009555_080080 [Acrocarpospora macrocephala]|uniref:DUF2470 domain-containing protein n=1 Tax=Acrocarpospora macrocephala TaxID=150177 RepID=A0A5M3XBH9_9ACTN|nr:DUF2470 domain-containing protein [Acrocarpospora macrocephala]GES16851.1 hypothetical protein Amac_104490 [Acrocarpospora macrocephala]
MQHPVTAPPIPERVRTLAAGAAPTHVSVAGSVLPAAAVRGGVDAEGRPVLLVKPAELLYDLTDEIVVTVDLVATRAIDGVDRARGMLKVRGWAQPVPPERIRDTAIAISERCPDEDLFAAIESRGPRLLRVDAAQVVYLTGQESGVLDAEDYFTAAPDPLLDAAERILHHVNSSHRPQLVHAMTALLGTPVPNAWIWELDRYGTTIRTAPDHLLRLPWPTPATSPDELEHALASLMCPNRH